MKDIGIMQAQSQAWAVMRDSLPHIERILRDGPKLTDRPLIEDCLTIVVGELYYRLVDALPEKETQ